MAGPEEIIAATADPTPPSVGAAGALTVLAPLLDPPIVVVDAGARWGVMSEWDPLEERCLVVGFEPEPAEAARLAARYGDDATVRIVPLALGDSEGTIELVVTDDASGSSLFEPVTDDGASRPGASVVDRPIVGLTTLRRWVEDDTAIHAVDAIKLDVQGAELAILRGAGSLLDSTRILMTESHLNSMYTDAPLFGEVDALLREHGFVLWNLPTIARYTEREHLPRSIDRVDVVWSDDRPTPVPSTSSRVAWADIVYVKSDFGNADPVASVDRLVRDAVLALGFGEVGVAVAALTAARIVAADVDVRRTIDTALDRLRFHDPVGAYEGSRLQHLDAIAERLTEPFEVDLAGPIDGWGWHAPMPDGIGGVTRWTGPQRESALRLPIELRGGETVTVVLTGAVSDEVLASTAIEVDGRELPTTVTATDDGMTVAAIVHDDVRPGHTCVVLRCSRTVEWSEVDPSSTDRTRFGLCVRSVRIDP